jgi:hypothetical protein
MPRPIRYRSRSENSAQSVFETLADRAYLEARQAELGGKGAAVLEFDAGGSPAERAEFTVRQGVGREHLPSVIQKVLSGDLVIERTENWRCTGEGRYEGTVEANVAGAPGRINGTMLLVDLDDIGGGRPGSEFALDGEAQVKIPLVGGKVEAVIAEQVEKLVGKETRFLLDWLAR